MTGPEHYREAERLLDKAHHYTYGDGADPTTGAALAAEATGHATLAVAAATAMQAPVDGSEPGMGSSEFDAWYHAAGVKPTAAPTQAPTPDQAAHELDVLRVVVAQLLHDVATSADDQAPELLVQFRNELADTTYGRPVLEIAESLMRSLEGDLAEGPTADELYEMDRAAEFAHDAAADAENTAAVEAEEAGEYR
jgi:hypothetical protein